MKNILMHLRFPINKIILLIFISSAASFGIFAQQDTVTLKNGTQIIGKVIKYEIGNALTIAINNGTEVVVPESSMQTLKGSQADTKQSASAFVRKTKGLYAGVATNVYMGTTGRTNYVSAGLESTVGYRFFQALQVGAGLSLMPHYGDISIADYNLLTGIEICGTFGKGRVAPFYSINGGYGQPLGHKHDSENISAKYKGNWFAHPSVGLKIGVGKKHTDLKLDIGYLFYTPSYSYTQVNWLGQEDKTEYRYSYRSLVIRFGADF